VSMSFEDNAERLLDLLFSDTPAMRTGAAPNANDLPVFDGSTQLWNGTKVPSAFGLQPLLVSEDVDVGNPWELYVCDASAADFTIALPDPAYMNFAVPQVGVKMIGASGTVTINPFDAETIEGGASLALDAQYDMALLISDGTNWWRLI
jgi:hypothetical protein